MCVLKLKMLKDQPRYSPLDRLLPKCVCDPAFHLSRVPMNMHVLAHVCPPAWILSHTCMPPPMHAHTYISHIHEYPHTGTLSHIHSSTHSHSAHAHIQAHSYTCLGMLTHTQAQVHTQAHVYTHRTHTCCKT